ncbi:hypothetical protein PQX77_014467 [Marasmius sp. AFHP31]|nr:hypothetical protein PQX77_014467 [Marasmius sp. AFHP31]
MAPKRKRRASPSSKGLAAGEVLRRERLAGNATSPWGWVGTEVNDASRITHEHMLTVYGLSSRTPRCPNKYTPGKTATQVREDHPLAKGELEEDIIIVSDDDDIPCNKKDCRSNPFCPNYLGQDKWDDEGKARIMWDKTADLGPNPTRLSRKPGMPVGLKNLGATCYANASLQESPIFQLQVTFTALQESIQKAFNPTKLVESLQLRTGEQQDAQEFSKLFMSHLDTEFKKQSDPRVQSLVNDLFEGEQVYGTACSNCQNRSERTSNFLELEINFQNKSKLSDCVQSLLQPEELTDDNNLQDATRYTELRRLPPVLHFSLLRFVFNLATLERKKSKNIISFPRELDMDPFVRNSAAGSPSTGNVYELRGILLHKGPSAYHGHYEAQVYDSVAQSWFQFNDEVKQPPAKRNNQSNNSRKRQRIEDSDEEIREVPLSEVSPSASFISSKDAYMLIYVRKSPDLKESTKPSPPSHALQVINEMNQAHSTECEEYKQKEETSSKALEVLRSQVMDVYRTWELTSEDEDLLIVNRRCLEAWLSNESGTAPNTLQQEILCEHGQLDWSKAKELKCIKHSTYNQLKDHAGLSPIHSLQDLCESCVKAEFNERLYQLEHPRSVAHFQELDSGGPEGVGYWMSKAWIRDWLLQKPKMHVPYQNDPPPDAPDYDQVRCEHDGLSLNTTGRRRISVEACEFLVTLFPQWKPMPIDEESCSVCEALLYERKTNGLEHRRRAEEEKLKLKRMYDHACNAGLAGTRDFLEHVNLAIIPSSFLRHWKLWATKPTENDRPETLDNSVFLCEHNMLLFEPRAYHLDDNVAAVLHEEWDILVQLYNAGPLITLERNEGCIECPVAVCELCRQRLRTDWESTDLIIRIGKKEDAEGQSKPKKQRVTYSRQSRRLRQLRRDGDTRRVNVTKATTVRDIKISLQKTLNIPTICQRLFYKFQELEDGSATVGSLGLLANDIIEFQEQGEVHEITDSDNEDGAGSKRDEGRGFGGTVLAGGSGSFRPVNGSTLEVQAAGRESSFGNEPTCSEKSCSACTFINPPDATFCNICSTSLV